MRGLFKQRMKDKMSFTNTDWNQNVDTNSDWKLENGLEVTEAMNKLLNAGGGRHRRSKQMFKASNGTSYSMLSTCTKPPEKSPMHDQ